MRRVFATIALGVLSACAPGIPDSGPGSREDQRAREAALVNPGLPSPYAISDEPLTPDTGSDIAADTAAALAATSPDAESDGTTGTTTAPLSNPGISQENDFETVSAEQSIESDAARLANNREQYTQITPTTLPERISDTQPNVVSYAVQTNNLVGVKIYNRSSGSQAKFARNCAKYNSSDQAQAAFLELGGPEKDRKSLDPDGDGFACGWDPAPFRKAQRN